MIDHISLGVSDLGRSRRFYDAALRPLGRQGWPFILSSLKSVLETGKPIVISQHGAAQGDDGSGQGGNREEAVAGYGGGALIFELDSTPPRSTHPCRRRN